MLKSLFQRTQKYSTATNTGSSSRSNSSRTYSMPALALAFLLAIIASLFAIKSGQSLESQSTDYSAETAVDSQTGATEQGQVVNDDTGSESTPGSSTSTLEAGGNSVTTRTVIENGQASVQMEVNGEEVPVNQNGATQRTINTGDGQTNINVNVSNGQSTGFSSSFNSTTTNSTLNSSSFQSQTVWTSP